MQQLSFFEAERQLLPELDSLLEKRLRILRAIQLAGTIGRRTLCELVQLTEREVRNETEVLRQQNLINILQKGMICTEQGYEVLEKLSVLYHELSGLAQKEKALAAAFGIAKVVIVAGDVEHNRSLMQLLGKEASNELMRIVKPHSKIAVTGGQSVAALEPFLAPNKALASAVFIPARGGIGEDMQFQANTLAAAFAKQCQSTYRTLYTPEHLSEQAYYTMIQEPTVANIVQLYDEINIVIHGIGAAEEMVVRRNSPQEIRELLAARGAVGEAFGYYYDEHGQVVHHIRTIGIQLEQVLKSEHAIAIAAGASKAKAISAYFKNAAADSILITDEAAANAMLALQAKSM